jgi:hypothetical protein
MWRDFAGEALNVRYSYDPKTKRSTKASEDTQQLSYFGGLISLGRYLHADQDSFSHEGYDPLIGHLLDGSAPDKTYNDVAKADKMAEQTYASLLRAKNVLQTRFNRPTQEVQFDRVIRSLVNGFNTARSPGDKGTYLSYVVLYTLGMRVIRQQQQQLIDTPTVSLQTSINLRPLIQP